MRARLRVPPQLLYYYALYCCFTAALVPASEPTGRAVRARLRVPPQLSDQVQLQILCQPATEVYIYIHINYNIVLRQRTTKVYMKKYDNI